MKTGLYKLLSAFQIVTFGTIMLMYFCGCDWDPERDNPLDPGSPLYRSTSSLHVRVLTLDPNLAITGAKVEVFTDPVLSKFTDEDGWVHFNDIPVRTLTVTASADTDRDTIYAPISNEVIINHNNATEISFFLDAPPVFISTIANAETRQLVQNSDTLQYSVHLKARVQDPDGQVDLKSVEWVWRDAANGNLLSGNLSYRFDSLYFEAFVPGDSFINIDKALDGAFTLEAFDYQGYSTQSAPVRVVRVLHGVPYWHFQHYGTYQVPNPKLD
jgi:hypothetical protein